MIEGRAKLLDAALGGLFLALASLASWYHLLYGLVLTPVLFLDGVLRHRSAFLSKAFLFRALLLAGVYLLVAGPLLFAILHARSAEPITGAHDAVHFSGDLEAFFFPNLAQSWAADWGGRAFRWTGNAAETALYAGYGLLAAALLGAVFGRGLGRAYLAIGLLGGVLALGPYLHVGGKVMRDVKMPYLWLETILPQIEFMGVPVRLGYVMYFGLVVAAALGLANLRGRLLRPLVSRGHARVGAALSVVVLAPLGVSLAEYSPRPFIETRIEAPKPMLEWAKDPTPVAVAGTSRAWPSGASAGTGAFRSSPGCGVRASAPARS